MAEERGSHSLPVVVWDTIAGSIDICSLAACCCVCQDWNKPIRTDDNVWKVACEFSGLRPETFPPRCTGWREYALLILRRFREMRRSVCFLESGFTIDRTEEEGVVAIYYYKNQLAVALKRKIEMWSTSRQQLLFEIDCDTPRPSITSVKFDDRYIMVADSWGRIRSFEVSSQEQISSYEGPNENLTSYDFESDIGIVVGSYMNNYIEIWELLSGTQLRRMTTGLSLILKLKMVLIREPEIPERGVIYLFVMDGDRLFRWTITFDTPISEHAIEIDRNPWRLDLNISGALSRNFNPTTSLVSYKRLLYYPESSAYVQSESIGELDLDSMIPRQINPGGKIRNLLAVGEKYIAFRTAEEEGVLEKARVVEKLSNELRVAVSYELPEDLEDTSAKPDNDALVFCDRAWLDGLDSTNNSGAFLAYIRTDKKVYFVNWIPIEQFAP